MDTAARSQQTTHFRIHYSAGSFAEGETASIGGRLEKAYAAIQETLHVDFEDTIDVYLSELVVQYQGYRLGAGGYAVPDRLQIHDVYRPDSPGESLERSLLTIFITRATGIENPPEMLIDGLLVGVMQHLGSTLTEEQQEELLIEVKAQGALPPLAALLAGPSPALREIYYPAAASFVRFVLRTGRARNLVELAEWLRPGGGSASLAQAEAAWRKSIKAGAGGGVIRFVQVVGPYLQEFKLKVAEAVLYIVLASAFLVVMQLVPGWLVDVLHGQPAHILNLSITSPWPLIIALAVAFVVISIASQRQTYLSAFISASALKEMRLRAFSVIQDLHPGFFQGETSGEIISRMTSDMTVVQSAITGPMTQTVQGAVTIVLAVIIAVHTNWQMTLATAIFMPLFLIIGHFMGPRAAQSSREVQQQLGKATSTLQENLGAQQVVKAFGLRNYVVADYARDLTALFRATLRQTFLIGIYGLLIGSTATGINLFVLGLGAWMVLHGQMTTGILIQFLGLINQVIGPVRSFSTIIQSLQQASVSMDRVNELIESEPEIKDEPGATYLPPLAHAIEFKNVSFGYTEDEPVLQSVNLGIAAGTRVAFVGRSGSGKSTALSLLLRFYDPQSGQVTFDGKDIHRATLESLRSQLGVVLQENVLFNTTIRENIRLGNLDASDEEVTRAAQMAEIHDFIMGLPDEYDTVVGERGSRLSGGQRQRVAIARAIVRNPSVLLLDEATSALDPVTETAINQTLERVGEGRTTIAVTHRLSSVRTADQIFVFDQGSVVEHGTHEELLGQLGVYAQLWEEQGGGMVMTRQPVEGVEIGFLRRVPIFSQLEPELLTFLAGQLSLEHVGAGETIVSRGDPADKLYVIQKGQAEVLDPDPAAGNRPLAVLREGDHFGEVALLHDSPRTATVRARRPLVLYSLSRDDFNGLLITAPGLRQALEVRADERSQAGAKRSAATMVQRRDQLAPG